MHTPQELETVWKLFNLLEKLSNILFDRYHDYLMDRYLDEELLRSFEDHIDTLILLQSKQSDNLSNHPK